MNSDAYHADHSAISSSMLSVFRQSRRRYYRRFVAKVDPPPEPTAAMQLGTLFHLSLLEPDRFASEVIVMPKFDMRKKADKAAAVEFIAEHKDKQFANAEQFDLVRAMQDAVFANGTARSLLETPGKVEKPVYWEDLEAKLKCKCRPDKLCRNFILDAKTCRDSSPQGFASSAASFGYHRQADWYQTGIGCNNGGEILPFVFIAVSTDPPHEVGIYELDDAAMDLATNQNAAALRQLAQCHATGDWESPHEKLIMKLSLPKWSQFEDEYSVIS